MSTTNEFLADLNRVADNNGVWVDTDRLVRLVGDEIEMEDASCVNVFTTASHKNELLLVTSVSTWSLKQRLLKTKLLWRVRHDELDGVKVQQGLYRNYVYTKLVLKARGRKYEFQFGFFDGAAAAKSWREMAEHDAGIAQAEIERLFDRRPTASADPALDQLHRALALLDAGPPLDIESSDGWTQADYSRLAIWMMDAFDDRKHQAVWERRLALGYKLVEGDTTQADWFWINALAAQAGLNFGKKEHPFLSVCAGVADEVVDRNDIGQMAFMAQIKKQFFG